ncbi:hypothetical protein ACPEEZ_11300 [Frigoribacterium sp. 2-23]|uniref:hypothetical protein n=1 Tax=Frigoribacterium sp. 2-23 TaxID=3415006 RepID=UPI003C6F5245
MAASLDGFLWFDDVTFDVVRATDDPAVMICEYEAILRQADRADRLRRRYISVITLRDGRISHLREYGGLHADSLTKTVPAWRVDLSVDRRALAQPRLEVVTGFGARCAILKQLT